jgi:signal transduction histidine kinase
MPEKGILTLRTSFQGKDDRGWLEIMVKDNGTGIKKEDLPRIGCPFFTTKLKGSGLGMAICKKIIVERHGGRFSIDSGKEGTTVLIRFPVNP